MSVIYFNNLLFFFFFEIWILENGFFASIGRIVCNATIHCYYTWFRIRVTKHEELSGSVLIVCEHVRPWRYVWPCWPLANSFARTGRTDGRTGREWKINAFGLIAPDGSEPVKSKSVKTRTRTYIKWIWKYPRGKQSNQRSPPPDTLTAACRHRDNTQ